MTSTSKISAIILAGGKSSRMGQDKGLMLFNNEPMIAAIIKVVELFTKDVIIVSNQSGYDQFGYPVVEDEIKDSGPLAGIYTGLQNASSEKNIVLSCDVPFVSEELIRFLLENSAEYDVTIPQKGTKTHQIIGVYDKSVAGLFLEELKSGQRKIKWALDKVKLNIVDANHFDDEVFANMNSQEDLYRSNHMEVKMFGMLAEAVDQSAIKIEGEINSVNGLKAAILKAYPQLETMNFKVAVNQVLANNDQEIGSKDEIALLPPFAGG